MAQKGRRTGLPHHTGWVRVPLHQWRGPIGTNWTNLAFHLWAALFEVCCLVGKNRFDMHERRLKADRMGVDKAGDRCVDKAGVRYKAGKMRRES